MGGGAVHQSGLFAWEEDGLELEVAEVLPVEEISLAPAPDADASAPEAPADSDDTNGTKAAAASDAPAQAPHTEAPAAAQPAAPAVPTLPQTGTTGWMAGVLASLGQGGHCRGSGLCGGGSFRVGNLSRGVGCGGSFGAVGVVRVSRGFRGGGVCVGVRCQRDLFHRQNRQF